MVNPERVAEAIRDFQCSADEAEHQCVPQDSPEGADLREAFLAREAKRTEEWLQKFGGPTAQVTVTPGQPATTVITPERSDKFVVLPGGDVRFVAGL